MNDFLELLALGSPWGDIEAQREFFYVRGKTDVIAMDASGRVIAFEAKLSNWRKALRQAYRNTCFANQSYVLLPVDAASQALASAEDFKRMGVGICCIKEGIEIVYDAPELIPLQPWLSARASRHILSRRGVDDVHQS